MDYRGRKYYKIQCHRQFNEIIDCCIKHLIPGAKIHHVKPDQELSHLTVQKKVGCPSEYSNLLIRIIRFIEDYFGYYIICREIKESNIKFINSKIKEPNCFSCICTCCKKEDICPNKPCYDKENEVNPYE